MKRFKGTGKNVKVIWREDGGAYAVWVQINAGRIETPATRAPLTDHWSVLITMDGVLSMMVLVLMLLMTVMITRTHITRQSTGRWHVGYSDGVVFSRPRFLHPHLVPGLRPFLELQHLQTSKPPSVLTGEFHAIPPVQSLCSHQQFHRWEQLSGLD